MTMSAIYDPFLILLSVLVAMISSYVALNLAHSITQAKGKAQVAWLAAGSLALGVGIWSMHFVGMLAFEMPGMEMAYDIPLVILSIVVAVLGSGIALFVISRPVVTNKSMAWSGIFMAAAIAGMHYIGMYSMRMSARIVWNPYLVLLSIVIALVASYSALMIAFRLRNKPDRIVLLLASSVLMGVAIAGMHYTGMLAATFIHDDSVNIEGAHLLVTSGLTLATISTTFLILGLALAGSIGQRLWALRQLRSDEILGNSEEKFRLLVEAVKDYAIYMIDPNGYITTWNSGSEKIIGYRESEILSRHISVLYTKEDVDANIASTELEIARQTGQFEGEAVRVKKDGSRFWANIVINPLFTKDGRLTGYSKVTRDVTAFRENADELERRVRERTLALQQSEAQLRSVTNALPVLVAQTDLSERFLFANQYFCDWFHMNRDKVNSYTFREILGEDRYPANKGYIDRALKGETVTYERKSHSAEREADLNITFVPEFDAQSKCTGIIVVAADVTKYKQIEAELKSAKIEAEIANETKSAFLANMSHEIRTPLGAVIGFSELMLTTEMSAAERSSTVEIIKRNGKVLSTIINDILDLSKVEAGKLEIERTPVKLHELLNDVATLLKLEADGKGINFSVSSEGVVPLTINTDSTRLRQILFNIVGNAIKFTDKGFVALKVRLDEKDVNKLSFIIADSGAGIAPEQASRIFSPFTQGDVTTTRRFGGTGLGLVLSKQLAKALGGDVVLKHSVVGGGSVFFVTIDHGQSSEVFLETAEFVDLPKANIFSTPSPDRSKELFRLRVLTVDDSPDNLMLITRILTLSGAEVDTAENGREGVAMAMTGAYNIVLMDLQMPEMDGYQATRELRERGYTGTIIALTAHAMKEERQRCLANGFDGHLTKPIDRHALLSMLFRRQEPPQAQF